MASAARQTSFLMTPSLADILVDILDREPAFVKQKENPAAARGRGGQGGGNIDKSYRETSLHLNMRHIYNLSIPPDIPRTFREHVELVEALAQNSRRAVTIIKRHLARSRRNVLQGALLA